MFVKKWSVFHTQEKVAQTTTVWQPAKKAGSRMEPTATSGAQTL